MTNLRKSLAVPISKRRRLRSALLTASWLQLAQVGKPNAGTKFAANARNQTGQWERGATDARDPKLKFSCGTCDVVCRPQRTSCDFRHHTSCVRADEPTFRHVRAGRRESLV